MKNILNGTFDWVVWGLITAFLVWVLAAAVNGIFTVVPSIPWLGVILIPAGLLAAWLLFGCIKLAVKSWR